MERHLIVSLMLGACALAAASAAEAAPQYGQDGYGGQVIRCESANNRYRECAMETRGGVQLVRQLSSTRCEEGRNWGYGRGGIWVDRGCRGEFRSGSGGWNGGWSGSGQRIRCESDNGRTRTCAVPGRGDVRLVRQLSKARCTEGQSWGRDRNAVWVSRGCRAEFEVYGRGNNGWGGGGWQGDGAGQTFRCESDKGRDRICPADTRRGVQLVRQLSGSPCVEGRTWGRDARGVWVTAGCRAEFRSW